MSKRKAQVAANYRMNSVVIRRQGKGESNYVILKSLNLYPWIVKNAITLEEKIKLLWGKDILNEMKKSFCISSTWLGVIRLAQNDVLPIWTLENIYLREEHCNFLKASTFKVFMLLMGECKSLKKSIKSYQIQLPTNEEM